MRVRLSLFSYESDHLFSDYVPCGEDRLKVDSEAGSLHRKYMERKRKKKKNKKKHDLGYLFFFLPLSLIFPI